MDTFPGSQYGAEFSEKLFFQIVRLAPLESAFLFYLCVYLFISKCGDVASE